MPNYINNAQNYIGYNRKALELQRLVTDTENKLVVTLGERDWRGAGRERGLRGTNYWV